MVQALLYVISQNMVKNQFQLPHKISLVAPVLPFLHSHKPTFGHMRPPAISAALPQLRVLWNPKHRAMLIH